MTTDEVIKRAADAFCDLEVARIYGNRLHCPYCKSDTGHNEQMRGPTYIVCQCVNCFKSFIRLIERSPRAPMPA